MINDGPLDPQWVIAMTDKILQFQLEGDRIAVLRDKRGRGRRRRQGELTETRSEELLVKESLSERKFTSVVVGNIQQFQLEGSRIGVLRDGELLIQTDSLFSDLVLESSDVRDFQLAADRTGVLLINGAFLVDGVLYKRDMDSFVLKPGGSRFSYGVDSEGMLRYWIPAPAPEAFNCLEGLPEDGTIWDVQMGASRVGALVDGTLYVKQQP